MAEMAVVVSDRERQAKADMKHFYDRSAKVKSFNEGEMVLVRKPGLQSKIGDSSDRETYVPSYLYRCRVNPIEETIAL